MNYFNWTFDPGCNDVWFLDEPVMAPGTVVKSWAFKRCKPFPIPTEELRVPITKPGAMADAAFGAFDLLYLSPRMASALEAVAASDIQFVRVVADPSLEELFIANAVREITCIDEKRSTFTKWAVGNDVRPDKAGQYRNFVDLRIDPSLTEGADIFRPWGWHVALIVSERVKNAVEAVGARGTVFQSVT